MRFTLLIACAILLATSSCRMMSIPDTRTPSDPYVQLKNGKKFTGTSAERSTGIFVKDKIELGDTSFRSKDVAFYSTGGTTFANVGRKTFAHQVAAGKVNMYKYMSTSTTTSYSNGRSSTSTSHHINYYIQKNEGDPVKYLTYRNLKPMLEPKTPEYNMLEKYRKTRIVSRSLGYGSLGLLIAGCAMVSSNNDATSSIGGALIGGALVTYIGWACVYVPNHMRILKSVLIADKADKKHAHHNRVN